MNMIGVRMCEDPEGHGWKECPHTPTSRRTMGMTQDVPADSPITGDRGVLALLRQELSISAPRDSKGVQHMVPPGCEFVVHLQRGAAEDPAGGDRYTAVLTAPDAALDDLLAESPEWTAERMQERLTLLNSAA